MHVSIHGQCVAHTVYICYNYLVSATLIGVSQRGVSSSRLSPAKTGPVGFLTIIFYFNKVYLKTLDVCFRWLLNHVRSGHSLEGSDPFLRVVLVF